MKLRPFAPIPCPPRSYKAVELPCEVWTMSEPPDEEPSPVVYRFATEAQCDAFRTGHWPLRADEWP